VNPALASAWPAGSVTWRKLLRALFEESTKILSTGQAAPRATALRMDRTSGEASTDVLPPQFSPNNGFGAA
jgi:hypothetical protein